MLKFGFIATKRELKLLVRPLVRILDSRKGKAAALFDDDDRYKIESTDERLLCEIKQQIIRVLMRVNRTRGILSRLHLSLVCLCFVPLKAVDPWLAVPSAQTIGACACSCGGSATR